MRENETHGKSRIELVTKAIFLLPAFGIICSTALCSPSEKFLTFYGMSDASAAVAVDAETFIVADDEDNLLRVYKISNNSIPIFSYDLTQFLGLAAEHPEADIEGATMVGNRIYWITSHGRSREGEIRPNRYRFFATVVKTQDKLITIGTDGIPCKTLIHSLVKTDTICRAELEQATLFDMANLTKQQCNSLAPQKNGLNVEALCASPDGKTIFIGFRSPLFYDKSTSPAKAIVIPLNNPAEVIQERDNKPVFGAPMLWDLQGCGIRSMEYSHYHKAYFVVAGPAGGKSRFALYRWSGEKDSPPVLVRQIGSEKDLFNPEALLAFRDSPKLLLLSDDGNLTIAVSNNSECMPGKLLKDGKCLNKNLKNPNKKCFRGMWLEPSTFEPTI